jgi:hypothetical protein
MTEYDNYLKEQVKQSIAYSEYVASYVNQLADSKDPPVRIKRLENKSLWSRLRIESKIMTIIGIIGLILSFLTLVTR